MSGVEPKMERPMIVQIEPWIDQSELGALERVIRSTYLIEHELTQEFESRIAELTGAAHAIAVCNGTMALYVCLKVLGIGPGDEVIVPDMTFIASSNAVILAGATPVLCEVREDTFCIDIARAEELVTGRTRAVMPVHLYGQAADMDAVLDFAIKHRLRVIEDAAEAIGVRFEGRHVGAIGDCGILSFYGNKTVTCGQGGVVLTNDDELARSAYRLKNYGRDQKGTFIHHSIGFNFGFTDLQAAIGIAQIEKMPRIVARKREIHDQYVRGLADLPTVEAVYIDPRCEPVFWFTSILCGDAEELARYLSAHHVQSRRLFYPLHLQPCYADGNVVRVLEDGFRISERIYHRGLSLPSSCNLTPDDQAYVIEQIHAFYADRH